MSEPADARIARLEDLVERRLAALNVHSGSWTADQIKEFVESILMEKDRALAMADQEREKAAAALRNEQQRALDQAERERGKAADNLRVELARAIKEGDERLREHIYQQVMQINAALISSDKLEESRIKSVSDAVESLSSQFTLIRDAHATEQLKFEAEVGKRFDQVNEFRKALDDLSKQMATRRELESVVTTLSDRIDELNKAHSDFRSRLDVGPAALADLKSRSDQAQGRQTGIGVSTTFVVGAVGFVATVLGIVIVLSNVLTGA